MSENSDGSSIGAVFLAWPLELWSADAGDADSARGAKRGWTRREQVEGMRKKRMRRGMRQSRNAAGSNARAWHARSPWTGPEGSQDG